jgi:hypothetical protein
MTAMIAHHNRIAARIRQQAAGQMGLETLHLPWTRALPE